LQKDIHRLSPAAGAYLPGNPVKSKIKNLFLAGAYLCNTGTHPRKRFESPALKILTIFKGRPPRHFTHFQSLNNGYRGLAGPASFFVVSIHRKGRDKSPKQSETGDGRTQEQFCGRDLFVLFEGV
jgi:hypothetical protein